MNQIFLQKIEILLYFWNASLSNYYACWKPILDKQIELYQPDVIIFGNTFSCFKADMVGSDRQPDITIGDHSFHVYRHNGRLLIDAYHPNQRTITREEYVNSLIDQILCSSRKS